MDKLYSVTVYLIVFYITILCCYFFSKKNKLYGKKNDVAKVVMFSLVVAFPCILAGIRGDYVGTDMQVYLIPDFNCALNSNTLEDFYLRLGKHRISEIGYLCLVYISAAISNDAGLLLFLLQLFTFLPVIIGCYLLRDEVSVPYAVAVYFFLFYNLTFNVMRQSVACSLVFLGIIFLKKSLWIKSIVAMILAMSFHKTVIIVLGLFFLIFTFSKYVNNNAVQLSIIVWCLVVFFIFNKYIFELILLYCPVPGYLEYYIRDIVFKENLYSVHVLKGISFGVVAEASLRIFITMYTVYLVHKKFFFNKFIINTTFIGCLLYVLSLLFFDSIYVYRVTQYFDWFLILLIPLSLRDNNKFLKIFMLLLLIIYWFGVYIHMGNHATNYYYFR